MNRRGEIRQRKISAKELREKLSTPLQVQRLHFPGRRTRIPAGQCVRIDGPCVVHVRDEVLVWIEAAPDVKIAGPANQNS